MAMQTQDRIHSILTHFVAFLYLTICQSALFKWDFLLQLIGLLVPMYATYCFIFNYMFFNA
jgi:hypothetical protein